MYTLAVVFKSDLELVKLTDSTSAMCLDGSPAGYYIGKGSGENVNNFLIYFLGGGCCAGTT